MKRKFFIAGGGTGGHIYPGVAIAKALESINTNLDIEFVGSQLGLETKIIPREGFVLHLLSAGKLNYKGSLIGKFFGLLKVFFGFIQAFILLKREKPVGVLGVGGYASGPLVMAAAILRIPTSIWEPNAHPGLTNRWLAKFVQRSFIVFDVARRYLKSSEVHLVGLPVRSELELLNPKTSTSEFNLLSFGGSQGARAINEILEKSVLEESQWLYRTKLIHQTGVTDFTRVKLTYERSVFDVKAFEYLFDMDQRYQWSDLVICRSGASTIAELAAVGRAALLVPLPTAADDHQKKNAMAMVEKNAAILLEQKDLSVSKLTEILLDLQSNPAKIAEMEKNAKLMHKPKAAEAIAKILNQHLSGK